MFTEKQVLDDALISMQTYLSSALPGIKQLANDFYLGASSENWNQLSQLLEGLMWISQTIDSIRASAVYQNTAVFGEIAVMLNEELPNFEQALTNNDMTLTGDILKYEIVSLLDQLLNAVTLTIDNEVVRHDLNG